MQPFGAGAATPAAIKKREAENPRTAYRGKPVGYNWRHIDCGVPHAGMGVRAREDERNGEAVRACVATGHG